MGLCSYGFPARNAHDGLFKAGTETQSLGATIRLSKFRRMKTWANALMSP